MSTAEQDRYQHEKQLGAGAMGEVWLATDTLLDRPVAIKYLKATENFIHKELFLTEARTLAGLNHPNITLIYDAIFDEDHNQFYLLMEYVEGHSLGELIERWDGPMPLNTVLDISLGLLLALEFAHGKGIVHRDLKPENVIMQDGQVKLTDFGLASLISLLAQGQNFMVGTPDYMPPEQVVGAPVDERSDLYALGIIMYEMLSGGHVPFEDYSQLSALLEAQVKQPPPPLSNYVSGLPLSVTHLINRLLQKEPADRYPNAGSVISVVKAIQARQKYSQPHLNLLQTNASPFVGRAQELAHLESVWLVCRKTAQPRMLVIQGELGIGKERLVAEFLGQHIVDRGYVALAGRCDEAGTPYAPFAEMLATLFERELVLNDDPELIDRLVEQMPHLGRLLNLPHSASLKIIGLGDEGGDSLPLQWQFFASILALFSELGPSVLLFQNANYLDEASLNLIQFLIHQGQLPLLFVSICRSDLTPLNWFDSLAVDEKEQLELTPFSTPHTQVILMNLLGGPVSEGLVSLIKRRSNGNPLYIEETIQQLKDAEELYLGEDGMWRYVPPKQAETGLDAFLPKSVMSAFKRQLKKLSPEELDALAQAALLEPGSEFRFSVWLKVLGGDSRREWAQDLVSLAQKRRFLRRIDNDHYAFNPADVNAELIAGIPKVRQRELHRHIATLLDQEHVDPILVGYHYEQAGQSTEAAHYLQAAGASAMSSNAVNTAINYYNRAISLVESASAYKALGTLYRRNDERAQAINYYTRALQLAQQSGDETEQAQILNGLVFTLWLADRYREAYQHAITILNLPLAPLNEKAIAHSHLGMISWLAGRLEEADEWCQKAVNMLLDSGDDVSLAGAFNRLGLVKFAQGELNEAQKTSRQSLELRRQANDYWGQGYCLTSLGNIAAEQGDFETGLTLFYEALQLFEKVNSHDGQMLVYTNYGRAILRQKQPDRAMPWLTKALHLALKIGKRRSYGLGDIYLLMAEASLIAEELDRAEAAAQDGLKLVESAGNRQFIAVGQSLMAQIKAAQGDAVAADALFSQALSLAQEVGYRAGVVRTKLAYAHFLGQEDQADKANTLENEAHTEAESIGLYLG